MVDMDERELLASLKAYLEELKESGVLDLEYGPTPVTRAEVSAPAGEPAPRPRVKGVGNPQARLLLLLDGAELAEPSEELLARMIRAMGFAMEEIYLMSFEREEGGEAALREALVAGIRSVAPEVVVAFGERAAQVVTKSSDPIAKLRGRFIAVDGIQLMATLHPDQMVADERLKRQVWQEMQQVMGRLKEGK